MIVDDINAVHVIARIKGLAELTKIKDRRNKAQEIVDTLVALRKKEVEEHNSTVKEREKVTAGIERRRVDGLQAALIRSIEIIHKVTKEW